MMNIYELECYWCDDAELDEEFTFEYLVHDEKFSCEDFEKMCREALNNIEYKEILEVKSYLVKKYNFKHLPITTRFNYERI
jgi:hypothetical protein